MEEFTVLTLANKITDFQDPEIYIRFMKTSWEKEILLKASNFFICHVLYLLRQLKLTYTNIKIVICRHFQSESEICTLRRD